MKLVPSSLPRSSYVPSSLTGNKDPILSNLFSCTVQSLWVNCSGFTCGKFIGSFKGFAFEFLFFAAFLEVL